MKTFVFLFSIIIYQLTLAQYTENSVFTDPGFQYISTTQQAKALVDSINQLDQEQFMVLDRISDSTINGSRVVKAIYYCDRPLGYCDCSNQVDCIDLRYGIESQNELKIHPFLTRARRFDKDKFLCELHRDVWITGKDGNVLEVPKCIDDYDRYFLVESNNKYGVITSSLDQIIPCEYDWIGSRNEVVFTEVMWDSESYEQYKTYAARKGGKTGIIDDIGNERLPFIYEDIVEFFRDDLIIAKRNGKWGLTNFQQDTLLAFEYDSILFVKDEIALKKGKWGFMPADLSSTPSSFELDDIKTINNRRVFALARKGKSWGIIDESGAFTQPAIYQDVKVLPFEYWGWDTPVIGFKLKNKWALYYCDDDHQGFETDFIYDDITAWEYRRGQKLDSDGGLVMSYPLYWVTVQQKGKKITWSFSEYYIGTDLF